MKNFILTIFASLLIVSTQSFAPVSRAFRSTQTTPQTATLFQPPALQRQRKSVASVQTMGLFGLGAPEIAVILIAAAFLLGPQKLAELGKDAGKIAGELKEVPKEFQKGLEEGEKSAKEMKAAQDTEVQVEEEKKKD